MLGQPLYMLMPEVIGFELTGDHCRLRRHCDRHGAYVSWKSCAEEGVVGKFVEFFGTAGIEQDERR